MPANRPFESSSNMILSVIFPGYIFYAFYRIKKLRKFMAILLLFVIIPMSSTYAIQQQYDTPFEILTTEELIQKQTDQEMVKTIVSIMIIFIIIGYPASAFFFLRRWSKQWNEQFDSIP